MPSLFEPLPLAGRSLENRIVVSPMCQYSAQDGVANGWHQAHLGQFALSGAGLVMTEATHVSAVGRITPGCLGLWSDTHEQALSGIIAFFRRFGGSPIGIQLAHAGRKGSACVPWEGGKPLRPGEAWTTLAPSAVAYDEDWPTPRALDQAGLAEVKAEFVAAATRAVRLGFDAAELHMAHGYLAHEFLSPLSNRREDGYGGDLTGRMRYPLELFEAVRAVWPRDRPLGVRISATDYVPGEGWSIEDSVTFARELEGLGCDFVDVSGGGLSPRQEIESVPGYQVPFAERIRRETNLATIAVGMITEPDQAEAIVAEGRADLVALARAFLRNPRWAWDAADALGAETFCPPQYARARRLRRPS